MSHRFFLDASALAKRYVLEQGTPLLNHLFGRVSRARLMCLELGTLEVVSIFVRKRNGSRISGTTFNQALTRLRREVVGAPDFVKLPISDSLITAAWPLVIAHSINSTDGVLLRSALDVHTQLNALGDALALVASDLRLLRAAQAEGLTTFNPETQSQADLDVLIGP